MRPGLPLPSSLHGSSAFAIALLGGAAAYVLLRLGDVGGGGYDALRDVFFYNALLLSAALFCLARPVFRRDARLPSSASLGRSSVRTRDNPGRSSVWACWLG